MFLLAQVYNVGLSGQRINGPKWSWVWRVKTRYVGKKGLNQHENLRGVYVRKASHFKPGIREAIDQSYCISIGHSPEKEGKHWCTNN